MSLSYLLTEGEECNSELKIKSTFSFEDSFVNRGGSGYYHKLKSFITQAASISLFLGS